MGKERNGINLNCKSCGKEFYVPSYRKNTAKFCSHLCQNHKQYDKYVFNCQSCGKEVITSPSRKIESKKFCSLECREHNSMGIKERRQRIKALQHLKRGTKGSRGLRKYVFMFVPRRCEICAYDEHDFCLDLHHIDEDPTNNELDNIAVLCCMCHRKLHKGILKLGEHNGKINIEKTEQIAQIGVCDSLGT